MYVLGSERHVSMELDSWRAKETKKQNSYGLLGGKPRGRKPIQFV